MNNLLEKIIYLMEIGEIPYNCYDASNNANFVFNIEIKKNQFIRLTILNNDKLSIFYQAKNYTIYDSHIIQKLNHFVYQKVFQEILGDNCLHNIEIMYERNLLNQNINTSDNSKKNKL